MEERRIKLPKEYVKELRAQGHDIPDSVPVRGPCPQEAAGPMDDQAACGYSEAAPFPGASGGPAPAAPKKRRRRHPIVWRVVFTLLALGVLGCAALGGYLWHETKNDFLWLDLEQLPHKAATILYAQDRDTGAWEEYARLEATQQKIWVDLEDIPLEMQHAFVAIEDRDFYDHHGVSIKRTAYAVLNEVKKKLTGTYFGGENGIKQGASTIDQQLIKNLTRDEDGTGLSGYLRKVREIYRAFLLDAKYDKDTILEAYLNVISFTGNTAGVEAESIKLYGCSAKDLTLAQCASIAAITKNPARYDPAKHPDNNLTRRNYILYEMWQQGYITEEQYNAASAEPIVLAPGAVEVPETETTSWFTDQVIEDVSDGLSAAYGLNRAETTNLLYNGGLRVYTTVDTQVQAAMENAMQNGGYFSRPGVPSKAAVYGEDGKKVLDENGEPVLEAVTEYPQAAMVTIDYAGRLVGVVGGLDDKEVSRGFNRGTDAVRQVGSTMKPIGAYALALEKNKINWSTPFLDAPLRQEEDAATGEKKDWPANFSKTYSEEEILVADALAQSINTIAVRVGEKAGVNNIYNFVTGRLGITSFVPQDKDLGPMVLGSSTYGVTPYELAGAYMMFGSGGTVTTLHSYESVQTGYGKEILEPQVETKQALGTDTAWIMNRLLGGVMEGGGTAAGYRVPGEMDSVGKTGTSSDNRDFWFVGLTPYYVTATWYGYDSGFALNTSGGTHAPTRAWRAAMQQAQQGLEARQFPQDAGVTTADYCADCGGLADDRCPRTGTGWYKAGALPGPCTCIHAA